MSTQYDVWPSNASSTSSEILWLSATGVSSANTCGWRQSPYLSGSRCKKVLLLLFILPSRAIEECAAEATCSQVVSPSVRCPHDAIFLHLLGRGISMKLEQNIQRVSGHC